MADCIHYNYNWLELLVPSYKGLKKICSSREKSVLFIVSLVRLCIVLRIVMWLGLSYDKVMDYKLSLGYIFFMVCVVYLFMNSLYLMMVILRKPEYDQFEMEQEAEIIAMVLKEYEINKDKKVDELNKNIITSEIVMTYDKKNPISTTY
jgi:hypothetical protein